MQDLDNDHIDKDVVEDQNPGYFTINRYKCKAKRQGIL